MTVIIIINQSHHSVHVAAGKRTEVLNLAILHLVAIIIDDVAGDDIHSRRA